MVFSSARWSIDLVSLVNFALVLYKALSWGDCFISKFRQRMMNYFLEDRLERVMS